MKLTRAQKQSLARQSNIDHPLTLDELRKVLEVVEEMILIPVVNKWNLNNTQLKEMRENLNERIDAKHSQEYIPERTEREWNRIDEEVI
tara:strand:- start:213 stop:479 length:267 start_codon:yes stop_codon:yes gene_type:complete